MNDLPQLLAIQQIGRTHRVFLQAFEATIGHSMPRWRIFLRLSQAGRLSQKQLARDLGLDPASLTRQIKAMEHQGWVRRANDPADNRLTNVELTEAGWAVFREAFPRRSAFIENAFGDLSADEVASLVSLLQKLENHLLSDLALAQSKKNPVDEPGASTQ